MPIGVRIIQAIEFRKGNCSIHGIALTRPILQVLSRVFAVQAMEELPGCIGELEKWLTVGRHDESRIVADL